MTDRLGDLLRDADAGAPALPAIPALAQHIHRRAHARVRRRQTAAVMLLVIGSSAAFWINRTRDRDFTPSIAKSISPPVSPAAVGRLKADAEIHCAVVDVLLAREARRRPEQTVSLPTIDAERDKAALAMLDHAERLRRDLKQIDAALATYQRAIELFPGSRWAAIAKQRIEQLKPDARRFTAEHHYT